MNYHYHLQGLIYGLINGTRYEYIHDKDGFKFFCYSNIFPISNQIMKNDIRKMIISSPDPNFISVLDGQFNSFSKAINIGNMRFELDSVKRLDMKIPSHLPFTMITGTPIIIRIPREKYVKYGIASRLDYEYLYWRKDQPARLADLQSWIPALDNGNVEKALKKGGLKVADIGCGHGVSTILMAKAYPDSKFYGFDNHAESIEHARNKAKQEGC
jgi:Methyltransferase domain